MLRNQIDRAPQQLRQLPRQRQALCEQVVARVELHQKIHIALWALFPPCHRAENADAPGTVQAAQCGNGVFAGMQLGEQHVAVLWG